MPFDIESRRKAKMHNDNRIFVLQPMEGRPTLSSSGSVDNRLFTGENKLHAIRDIKKGMWFLRYDNGATPSGLDVTFTDFTLLVEFVKAFYIRRNVEVTEVLE
jgi:hypothetical protein